MTIATSCASPSAARPLEAPTARCDSRGCPADAHLRPHAEGAGLISSTSLLQLARVSGCRGPRTRSGTWDLRTPTPPLYVDALVSPFHTKSLLSAVGRRDTFLVRSSGCPTQHVNYESSGLIAPCPTERTARLWRAQLCLPILCTPSHFLHIFPFVHRFRRCPPIRGVGSGPHPAVQTRDALECSTRKRAPENRVTRKRRGEGKAGTQPRPYHRAPLCASSEGVASLEGAARGELRGASSARRPL